jgi:CheY-like chemotaxis protein
LPAERVLIVDDEEDIRAVAAMALELVGGFRVSLAASGAEALAQAEDDPPDAILLDVMMPGLDGPATYRLLQQRESTRSIPVLLLTAKVQAADRRRFAELGVSGVVAKPFDPMRLAAQVSDALGWD